MKKRLLQLLIVIVLVSLLLPFTVSCALYYVHLRGVDQYNERPAISFLNKLLPNGFLEAYPYVEADYSYDGSIDSKLFYREDAILLYIKYANREIYEQAKQDLMDHFEKMSSDVFATYDTFDFHLNEAIYKDEEERADDFPESLKMLAFSDEKQEIVSIGLYNSRDLMIPIEDWSAFLAAYFPSFDWKKGCFRE